MENQIISLVEGFINTMIELHNCDPEEEERLYGIAESQLLELTDKALFLLGGREEYLETMLFQLISQKLPQGAVMDCFGNFKEDLDQVIARTLEVYHQQRNGLSNDKDGCEELEKSEAAYTEDTYDEFSEDGEVENKDSQTATYYQEEWETVIDNTMTAEDEYYDEDYDTEPFEKEDEDSEEWEPGEAELEETEAEETDMEEDEAVDVDTEAVVQDTLEEARKEPGDAEDPGAAADSGEAEEPWEVEDPNEAEEEEDLLGRMVRLLFPGKEIISNYSMYDFSLDYFVPELDLAFIDADSKTTITSIGELWLRKAGIAVFKVNSKEIYNIKSLRRQLRRLMTEKDLEEKRIFDLSAE